MGAAFDPTDRLTVYGVICPECSREIIFDYHRKDLEGAVESGQISVFHRLRDEAGNVMGEHSHTVAIDDAQRSRIQSWLNPPA